MNTKAAEVEIEKPDITNPATKAAFNIKATLIDLLLPLYLIDKQKWVSMQEWKKQEKALQVRVK